MNDSSELPGSATRPEPAPSQPETPEVSRPEVSPVPAPAGEGAETSAPAALPVALGDAEAPAGKRPTYVFFGTVAAIALIADVTTKAWAEIELSRRVFSPSIVVLKDHLNFTLAYNRGGAWGLLQNASETIRKPFFLLVSALAILFIVSLYARLAPNQRALKWGLPLVLGGALGNLSDRITRSQVIDFIDYRADWILAMNKGIAKIAPSWSLTDHWPTFNVADIAICIGVGLMAVDMITSRRSSSPPASPEAAAETAVARSDDAQPSLPPSASS